MKSGAIFSKNRKHRLGLWRIWDATRGHVLYIGLNPSTAGAKENDATINKLIHFTKRFDLGGFYIVNLFSVICTDSSKLMQQPKLNSSVADIYIEHYAKKCDSVVYMYGRKGKGNELRIKQIDKLLLNKFDCVYCFGINKDLTPKHPLYLPSNTALELY